MGQYIDICCQSSVQWIFLSNINREVLLILKFDLFYWYISAIEYIIGGMPIITFLCLALLRFISTK